MQQIFRLFQQCNCDADPSSRGQPKCPVAGSTWAGTYVSMATTALLPGRENEKSLTKTLNQHQLLSEICRLFLQILDVIAKLLIVAKGKA